MKSKDTRPDVVGRTRHKMKQLSAEIDKLEGMLSKGIKTFQEGPRKLFVSVRKRRNAAMDKLHVLALQVYGNAGLQKAA